MTLCAILAASGGGKTFRRTFMAPPYVWDRAGSIVAQFLGRTHQGVFPWHCNVRPVHGDDPIREYHCSHRAIGPAVPLRSPFGAALAWHPENQEGFAAPGLVRVRAGVPTGSPVSPGSRQSGTSTYAPTRFISREVCH